MAGAIGALGLAALGIGLTDLGSAPGASPTAPGASTAISVGAVHAQGLTGLGEPAPAAAPLPAPAEPPARGGSGAGVSGGSTGSSGGAGVSGIPNAVGNRVVETGAVTLAVPSSSVQDALARLGTLATAEGGFVAASQSQLDTTAPSGTVTLRVPVGTFQTVLTTVGQYGKVTSEQVSGQDVTSQYVDLTARIAALQTSRSTYLQIETRATTIGDILAVQQQIDSVQQQLEQLQGQQRVLADQSDYATLTVSVTTSGGLPHPGPATSGLSGALHRAVGSFVRGVEDIIAALGPLLLVALVGLALVALGRLGWLGWRRVRRRTV
ncbi:MAG: DUF4349 domain-containing protein [Mycobacteriales bacterium]